MEDIQDPTPKAPPMMANVRGTLNGACTLIQRATVGLLCATPAKMALKFLSGRLHYFVVINL